MRFARPSALWIKRVRGLPYSRPSLLQSRHYRSKSFDPLRILFCGSDDFSINSLDALCTEQRKNDGLIESIDVVCRPGKWAGPSKKIFKEVPIAQKTRLLHLPLHQVDTFTGWTPPPVDLIIAVSFGLLVPRRLIEGAKYGGLNVHPSLLPDLHGPAPLHHALLDGDMFTGITVQTLHPTKMDGGQILAQTPLPGVPIPFPDSIKVPELRNYAGQLGAEMLVQSLREGLFVPPVTDYSSQAAQALEHRGRTPRHARKLGLEDKHIRWGAWTSDEILRRGRTLGALWSNITVPAFNQAGQQVWGTHKVIWTGHFERLDPQVPREEAQRYIEPGIPYATWDKSALMINTVDGMTLKTKALTVPGGKRGGVPQMIAKYSLVDPADQEGDGGVLYYPGWNVLT